MGSNSLAYMSEWSEFILASLHADGRLSLQVPSGLLGLQSVTRREEAASHFYPAGEKNMVSSIKSIWKTEKDI